MARISFLLSFLLLIPTLASADALKAYGLASLVPVLVICLVISVFMLVVGLNLTLRDFRSPQENPRLLTISFIVASTLFGIFLSSLSGALSDNEALFPNLFTEVYVPLAIILISLKKFWATQSRPAAVGWLGSVSACLLVMGAGVSGVFASPYPSGRGGVDPLIFYFFLSLIIWFIVAIKFSRKLPETVDNGLKNSILWVPFIGAILAAFYATLLCLSRAWLIHSSTPWPNVYLSEFLLEQLIRFLLGSLFGVLMLLVTIRSTTPNELA